MTKGTMRDNRVQTFVDSNQVGLDVDLKSQSVSLQVKNAKISVSSTNSLPLEKQTDPKVISPRCDMRLHAVNFGTVATFGNKSLQFASTVLEKADGSQVDLNYWGTV